MENSLHKLESSIPTDLVEDVLWVSSCLIMVGMANASSNAERRLYAALVALRQAGISKELLIELNDSGATFDDIADYLDRTEIAGRQITIDNRRTHELDGV